MDKTKFLLIDINKIIPYKNNNKDHGANIDEICKSIEKVGIRDPLEVDENFVLLAGHGRLLALKKLGVKEVKVIQYFDMTQDQKDAYRLLANRIADFSSYNIDNIKLELERLDDLDLFRAFDAFDIKFFEDKIDGDNEDTVPIPQNNDPIVQEGDIFHSHKTQKIFEESMNKSGIGMLYQLIWNKPGVNHVGGNYKQKHEPFFYASNGDPKFIEVIIARYYQYTKGNKDIKCISRELSISDILSNV